MKAEHFEENFLKRMIKWFFKSKIDGWCIEWAKQKLSVALTK